MISLLGPFAVGAASFDRTRFILFMAGLAAIAAVSICGETRSPPREPDIPAPAVSGEPAVVRFPHPLEDVRSDLQQIGLPWFLRRQGATQEIETPDDATLDVAVSVRGAQVGTFVEHLVALDADRSKLEVAFVPNDMALVARLAAPIETTLDPATLMRVVMAEHIRSSLNGGGFDMRVLTETPGSHMSVFRKAFMDSGKCENPQTDDFQSCSNVAGDAAIRRAYREEFAHRAGR